MIDDAVDRFRYAWARLHGSAEAGPPRPSVQGPAPAAAAVPESLVAAALGAVEFVDWRDAGNRAGAAGALEFAHPDAVDAMGTLINGQDLKQGAAVAAAANPGMSHGEGAVELCRSVLARGRLEARCPWNGEHLASETCVVFPGAPWRNPVYAYRFESAQPFYLLVVGFDRCRVLGLFLPRAQTAIGFDGPSPGPGGFGAQVAALRGFLLRHAGRIETRLAAGPAGDRHPALLLHSTHFAHGLWNEVAAVEPLLDALPPGARLHVRSEPNGPIHEIFPEISPGAILRHRAADLEEFYLRALEAGAFPAPLGRLFIPRSVAQRVVGSARAARAEDEAFARSIRRAHDTVLWLTIRHGARTCLNQRAALAALVDAVAERHPSLAVVIDGFTPGQGHRADPDVLEAERAIVRGIVADVAAPCTFVSLVGAALRQAFVWGGIADAYAANHGSIQHKIAWLHDAPGVAHGPLVPGFDPSRMLALVAREGCAPPEYVLGAPATRREPGPEDTRRDLDDYEIDPETLKAAVLAALQKRGAGEGPPRRAPAAKVLHEVDDAYFARPAADRMIASGSEAWGQARWHDALDHFTAAVKLVPDYPRAFQRLLSFLLNAHRMRLRRSVSARSQFLGLLLAQELEPNNAWARQQTLEALFDAGDQAEALMLLRTWLAFRPGLVHEELRPLVRPEQAEFFDRLWKRRLDGASGHPAPGSAEPERRPAPV